MESWFKFSIKNLLTNSTKYNTILNEGSRKGMIIEDYMKLPYTMLVQEMNDESGHYFYGRILEFDGC